MKNHDIEQAQKYMDEYLHDLKTIVNIDSGTYTKAGIDRVAHTCKNDFKHSDSPPASTNKNNMATTSSPHIPANHSMALA